MSRYPLDDDEGNVPPDSRNPLILYNASQGEADDLAIVNQVAERRMEEAEIEDQDTEHWLGIKDKHWHIIFVVINLIFAIIPSLVFAFLSYEREAGTNNVDKFTWFGILDAMSSLLVNVLMGYFFSYNLLAFVRDVCYPNDETKNGNWYKTGSFLFSMLLGAGTTFASLPLSKESLSWLPKGLAGLITVFFGWNTFTTRTLSVSIVTYNVLQWVVQVCVKRGHSSSSHAKKFFELMEDLERFGIPVGLIRSEGFEGQNLSVDKAQQRLNYNIACVKGFYAELAKQKFSHKYTCSERAVWWTTLSINIALSGLASVTLVLWLSLTGAGLNEVANGWGDNPVLTWVFAMSHLALYMRSGWNFSQTQLNLYYRPALKEYYEKVPHSTIKKTLVSATVGLFFSLGAYFSGGGYAKVVGDRTNIYGFGKVGDAVLHSDNLLARFYQYFFNWLKPMLSEENYFNIMYFIAGSMVNGGSAQNCFLAHPPKRLQFRCLFSAPPENTASCRDWYGDMTLQVLRNQTVGLFSPEMSQAICTARGEWVRASEKNFTDNEADNEEKQQSCCVNDY